MNTLKSIVTCSLLLFQASVSSADLVLVREHTEAWIGGGTVPSYGIRGNGVMICDLALSDLDGDGRPEIISFANANEPAATMRAELRVHRWDGETFELLDEQEWSADGPTDSASASARAVYCGDVDRDGVVDLITATEEYSGDRVSLRLQVWHWDSSSGRLVEFAQRRWERIFVDSMDVGDLDADGTIEIVVGGSRMFSSYGDALPHIKVIRFADAAFEEVAATEWEGVGRGRVIPRIGNVDSEPGLEIVAACATGLLDRSGTLSVWRFRGGEFSNLAELEVEGSRFIDLNLVDVDADSVMEIAAAGWLNADEPDLGLLDLYQFADGALSERERVTWRPEAGEGSRFMGLAAADLEGDARIEFAVAGRSVGLLESTLTLFSRDGVALHADQSEVWVATDRDRVNGLASRVRIGDVDADGDTEIITGGVAYFGENGEQELVIWRLAPDNLIDPLVEEPPRRVFPPFYARLRDLLPMPWPPIVYGIAVLGIVSLVVVVVGRFVTRRNGRGPSRGPGSS